MANALDDLRYISRYGYRDPWAEATKNITDSLLAYADSKNRRDTLLAKYESDKEQLEYERGRDDKEDLLDLYKESTAESKLTLLQNDNYSKHFPPGFAEAEIENNNKIVAYQNERDTRMTNIANATEVNQSIIDDLRWLERVVPGSETGTRAKVGTLKTSLTSQYNQQNQTRYISDKANAWKEQGLLEERQHADIMTELGPEGSVENAKLKLEDALSGNRATVEDLEEIYNEQKRMLVQKGNIFALPTILGEIEELEKSLSRHIPPHINIMRHPDNKPFSFIDKLSWMKLGRANKNVNARDSNVNQPDGTVTKNNVSEFACSD